MSEKTSPLGANRIDDPEVAYHMAHAEVPGRAVADEAAEKVRQEFEGAQPAAVQEESIEQALSQAEIDGLINSSAYSISFRIGRYGQVNVRHDSPDEHSLMPIQRMTEALAKNESRVLKIPEKDLNEAGVTEAITVLPWRRKNLTIVNYTTLVSRGSSPYRYHPAGDDRGGQHMSFSLALKPEDAERLLESYKQNPQLVRDMTEKLARNGNANVNYNDGSVRENDWLDARPPFEEWAEVNGGMSRIAFTTAGKKIPHESEIVEF